MFRIFFTLSDYPLKTGQNRPGTFLNDGTILV